MSALLPYLITGTVLGSLYGLAGLGLTLTYRTSGVFNFGHGALAAGAAYTFYTLHVEHGMAWFLAAAITVALWATVVAVVAEVVTRSLGDAPGAVVVVATIGLLLAVTGTLLLQFGEAVRPVPEFLPTSGFHLAGVIVTWGQVISMTIALLSAVGLYVFLRVARLGVLMRAVVENKTLVALNGERPLRLRLAGWSIGCAFAAVSGILVAPTLGLDATLLTFLVVQAFGACAVGRFSSLPATYAGGLAVGILASLATRYFTTQPLSGIPSSVPFLVLIVVLLVTPAGKLPQRRTSTRGIAPEVTPMARSTAIPSFLIGGAALIAVPSLVGSRLPIWTNAMGFVVIFLSLGLLVWVSGQISLCHLAFAAFGATTIAHLTPQLPWGVALVLTGAITAPLGVLLAVPAIRLSGIYLALLTLGFGVLMQNVVYPSSFMFGRALSVTVDRPVLGPINGGDRSMYYLALAITVVTALILRSVYVGQLGRILRAMSESPTMLSTHGLSVSSSRLIVFGISAFFAGIGGAMLVTQTGAASGLIFTPLQSITLLAVLATCGTRPLRSGVLAGAIYALAPSYVTTFGLEQQTLAFGVLAIAAAAIVIAKRDGIRARMEQLAVTSESRIGRGPILERITRSRAAERVTA